MPGVKTTERTQENWRGTEWHLRYVQTV